MNAAHLVRAIAEESALLQQHEDPTERAVGRALFRICTRALEISQAAEERKERIHSWALEAAHGSLGQD